MAATTTTTADDSFDAVVIELVVIELSFDPPCLA